MVASQQNIGGGRVRLYSWLVAALVCYSFVNPALADIITFGGQITQPQDSTVPAVNNPQLNDIALGDAYTVTFTFKGTTIPGLQFSPNLVFADTTDPVTLSSFFLVNLSIIGNGSFDDFSLLACLTGGTPCDQGNQLTANFRIPAALLKSQNVTATGLDEPHPLDILDDGGSTDIHGSITTYSYTGVAAVPEPSTRALLVIVLTLLTIGRSARKLALARQEKR
jgi:hypothetical protein